MLDKFSNSCGLVVNEQKGSSKNKKINDELNLYAMASQGAGYSDLREFWKKNQIKLPFLANAVRKHCKFCEQKRKSSFDIKKLKIFHEATGFYLNVRTNGHLYMQF